MNATAISLIVFACAFGAALLGVFLRAILPENHVNAESKDTVRLGVGMIATMAALVLGLLVTSAKNYYDSQSNQLTQLCANIVLLDRVLAHYGPETKETREVLHGAVARTVNLIWPQESNQQSNLAPSASGGEVLYDKIQELTPKNDIQRSLEAEASGVAIDIYKLRWLMFVQAGESISLPLLVMLVFSLAIVFASFGLFAPTNATVIVTLFFCALSVSAAIFVILEMYTPFSGLIEIPSSILRNVLAQLGR